MAYTIHTRVFLLVGVCVRAGGGAILTPKQTKHQLRQSQTEVSHPTARQILNDVSPHNETP